MIKMQNWHQVVKNVENANIDKLIMQNRISQIRKIKYKEELDRQVQEKHKVQSQYNSRKKQEKCQIQRLVQYENQSKLREKKQKEQIQRKYGQDNMGLINNHQKVMTQQSERKSLEKYSQHPFIKLVEGQDNRKLQTKSNFINQNRINDVQQKMKKRTLRMMKNQQAQQKNEFIALVQKQYQKRSVDRQSFKNKYLKIHQNELSPNQKLDFNMPVDKLYVSYLNNQMTHDKQRKHRQKIEEIDDKRITKFYAKQSQPDSSPAYLGRIPLSHQRKRQLHFINKHLGIDSKKVTQNQKWTTDLNISDHHEVYPNTNSKLKQRVQKYSILNPEAKGENERRHPIMKSAIHSQSVQIKPSIGESATNSPQKSRATTMRNSYNMIYGQKKSDQYQNANRRIKSELNDPSYGKANMLPQITKNQVKIQNKSANSPNVSIERKEYSRYDLITGSRTTFFA